LRNSKWNLTLPLKEARRNNELVSLADSEMLRFIDSINGVDLDVRIKTISEKRLEIESIKSKPKSKNNKNRIKKLYEELDELQYIKDYLCLIVDNNKDFNRANDDFVINGIKYTRLTASSGGLKNSVVIYVNKNLHSELQKRMDNGRSQNVELSPSKYGAYESLCCSASMPVKSKAKVLIVHDCETKIFENIIQLDDTKQSPPEMKIIESELNYNESDGYGLISPKLSLDYANELGEDYTPSGFIIRNSFCKGTVFTFDFHKFAETETQRKNDKRKYIVKDVWETEHDIRDIDLILTTSMLKLWKWYSSAKDYFENCEKNGYSFSVTKICPKGLEHERHLNYQFIQNYKLNDEDVDSLVKNTVTEIKDVVGGDYRKAILFLKGKDLTLENYHMRDYDFLTALMIDERLHKDPFVKDRINFFIKKRIKEAKIGVLAVKGNYQIVSGDPYSLCQHIFGIRATGLLGKGEFYSQYFVNRNIDKVVGFRAPMSCYNNIRKLKIVSNEQKNFWYQYMKTVMIFNSWDATAHAMNGLDKDGDAIFCIVDDTLLRNTENLNAIICVQKSAPTSSINRDSLIQSNKDSFGDDIGKTTNKITSMVERQSGFDESSREYIELDYRIMCGQMYQQNCIDRFKGIVSNPMPKAWFDPMECKIKDGDDDETILRKEFNQRILADKKPYFMRYVYSAENHKYTNYLKKTDCKCRREFKISLKELLELQSPTEEQVKFIEFYHKRMPLGMNPCTMNKICWTIENAVKEHSLRMKYDKSDFDSSILKSEHDYTKKDYYALESLYNLYLVKSQTFIKNLKANNRHLEKEDIDIARLDFIKEFQCEATLICSNKYELCNILVDLCYSSNNSKQFCWDICGRTIIENLLMKNNYKVNVPIKCGGGDISFGGEKFKMFEVEYEIEDVVEEESGIIG
jgi:hypothetical protein